MMDLYMVGLRHIPTHNHGDTFLHGGNMLLRFDNAVDDDGMVVITMTMVMIVMMMMMTIEIMAKLDLHLYREESFCSKYNCRY